MSFDDVTTPRRLPPPAPNEVISALDQEVRSRFARRTGSLESFLKDWVRLEASQDLFFNSRGSVGETYLQHLLAHGDIAMALGVARTCAFIAESTSADKVSGFMNNIDMEGNDLWHYLADNLTANEDEDSLEIAKLLIQLEIDYCRKNDKDESPLARLLIPNPRWQSINSLLQAKALTIAEMEESFPAAVISNDKLRGELMANIFFSDLADNEARLLNHLLAHVTSPKADKIERARTARCFFDYVSGPRLESVLMRLAETNYADSFTKMLEFLQSIAEDAFAAMAASDQQAAKANQQVFIYRRLGRRNRIFQNLLGKAIQANKPTYISDMMRMLRNEDLIVLKRNARGDTEREVMVVDKTAPSPSNPTMALLLQVDARGNLPFHNAVLGGREDCLRKIMFGLSLIDLHVIMTRVPNRFGLTVADLLSPENAYRKLSIEIKAQRLPIEDAQSMLTTVKAVDKRIIEYLSEALRKADDVINRTGGQSVAKPTFDLMKIPTVQLAIQNGTMPRPTPPAAQGPAAAGARR